MKKITGPFNLWEFPILNTILAIANSDKSSDEEDFNFKEINIERNSQGRVENVEILKGLNNE